MFSFNLCLLLVCCAYVNAVNHESTFKSLEIGVKQYKLNAVVYEKSIHFVLKTKFTGIDNIWAAFGLSKDTSMVSSY